MAPELLLVLAAVALGVGLAAGWTLRILVAQRKQIFSEALARKIEDRAKAKSSEILLQARQKAVEILEEAKKEEKEHQKKLEILRDRLAQKEAALEVRGQRQEEQALELKTQAKAIKELEEKLKELETEQLKELERITGLSREKAKDQLFEKIEQEHVQELAARLRKLESEGREVLEEKAKNILILAMQRLASVQSAEITSFSVALPSDEVKGRIIGKEGRNIRTFEKETGVEVIIDDTPEVGVISSFNPIRREIARVAMERLIKDGRIQPARIEKYVADAKVQVVEEIKRAGEEAVYKLGIVGVAPSLVKILGRLKFRTSYGQNVLEHSVEVARLAEMIASEIGVDVQLAKRAGLFHDIGKAVDQEIQGSHVEIGRKILKKFGEDEQVIKAMEAHHGEYEPEIPEAVVVEVADALSGARPGARRASLEEYLKRLEDLEAIAKDFEGVAKSYAIQAGREIRVFVEPEKITDDQAKLLARRIAASIEGQLKYPGEVKVHVIRESRVIEYAR
jgi:ribonuclease Y